MIPFSLRLALREGRAGVRRIGVFLLAVALGVGALVGLYSFQEDAARAARSEARAILGGDLRIQSQSPLPERVEVLLDSLEAEGAAVSRAISLASMVSVPALGRARLLQVNAVDGRYPAAGEVVDSPSGIWEGRGAAPGAFGEGAVLRQLGVEVGDTLRIGGAYFPVRGTVSGLPVDLGLQTVVGPPIFIALADLPETGLLGFGSLAQYRAFVLLPEGVEGDGVAERYRGELREAQVSIRSAREEAEELAQGFRNLSRFLGLVGLAALLLGGIGVAGAVHVYVREKLASVAVLRCLGARQGTAFRAYLLQAAGLGAGGAVLGAVLGVGIQHALPLLLGAFLPFTITPRLHPGALLVGVALGVWIAVVFALLPLLRTLDVPPLAALRTEVEGVGGGVKGRLRRGGVVILLLLTLLTLSALQLGAMGPALVLATSLALVVFALGGLAWILIRVTRRLVPGRAPFPLRQGVSGLARPGNQTAAVTIALGFGSFLMGSLLVVEANLRAALTLEGVDDRPSLLLFDIQRDQRAGVEALLGEVGAGPELFPIVPSRIQAVNGVAVGELSAGAPEGRVWSLRRLYRNTWREALGPLEELIAGEWWGGTDAPEVAAAVAEGALRISVEEEVAEVLGVGVGDRIRWDVQGIPVESVVASLRRVEWGSFQPNFYVIFEPGGLDGAPATFVGVVVLDDEAALAHLQGGLLENFPNVSFLDISAVREVLGRMADRIALVLLLMGGFVTGAGFLVLLAALLTTRYRRRREGALLRTLGAGRGVIRGTLLAEYAGVGIVAGASGLLLGGVGGVLALRWGFDGATTFPWTSLLGVWGGVILLTIVVGWGVSGPILRATPMETLRGEG